MAKLHRTLLFLVCLFGTAETALAQYANLKLDYAQKRFNDGRPLPAQRYFLIEGTIDSTVALIEGQIFRSAKSVLNGTAVPLYEQLWKRPKSNKNLYFELPMNFELKGNQHYDFRLRFYRVITIVESEQLFKQLNDALTAYFTSIQDYRAQKTVLRQPTSVVFARLNAIVREATTLYRHRANGSFGSFSEKIERQIELCSQAKTHADFAKATDNLSALWQYDLRQWVDSEELLLFKDQVQVQECLTERTAGYRPGIHFGYGVAALGFSPTNWDFAPYLGLAFPFEAKRPSRYINNYSLITGIVIQNLRDQQQNRYSGPLLKVPYYIGLNFRLFRVVHLSTAALLLEKKENVSFRKSLAVRPLLGVAIELNWNNK